MSIELDVLRSLWVGEESSYGVSLAGSFPMGFKAMPYKEGSAQMTQPQAMLDPMTGKLYADGHSLKVLGPRNGGTVSFETALHSHGVDLNGINTAPTIYTWPLFLMLKTIMGGSVTPSNPAASTLVAAGSTATVVNVTAGHGSRFVAGGAIAVTISGALEVREVLSVSTDAVSVKQAFSTAPTAGQAIKGCITVYMTEDPATSLQFICEGLESDDRRVMLGMQGSFTIAAALGELGTVGFNLTGCDWANLGSASPNAVSYTNFSPMAAIAAELTVPTVGSTTRNALAQSAMTFEPGITYAPQKSGLGIQTVGRMKRQASRPLIKGSFTVPFEDLTYYTARTNRTSLAVFQQIGNAAGSTVLISAPTVQVVDVQRAASGEGISGQTVTWEGRHDEALGGSSELLRSAFRLHFC
jgi:hypothetical protein